MAKLECEARAGKVRARGAAPALGSASPVIFGVGPAGPLNVVEIMRNVQTWRTMYKHARIDRNLMVVEFREQLTHHYQFHSLRRLRRPGLYPRHQRRLIETLSRNLRMSVGRGAHAHKRVCQRVGRLSVPLQMTHTSGFTHLVHVGDEVGHALNLVHGSLYYSNLQIIAVTLIHASSTLAGPRGDECRRGGRANAAEDALPVRLLRCDVKWL